MMPELRRRDGHQTHLDRESWQRTGAHFAKVGPPSSDSGCIEITGFAQRFFAQKLRDKWRLRIHVETIQRRPKDNLVPAGHGFWHPPFRQETQEMLVPKSAKAPARMKLRQEIEDIFVEKRIAHFD